MTALSPSAVADLAAGRVVARGVSPQSPEWPELVAAEAILIAAEQSARVERERRGGFHRTMRQGSAAIRQPPDTSATLLRGDVQANQT